MIPTLAGRARPSRRRRSGARPFTRASTTAARHEATEPARGHARSTSISSQSLLHGQASALAVGALADLHQTIDRLERRVDASAARVRCEHRSQSRLTPRVARDPGADRIVTRPKSRRLRPAVVRERVAALVTAPRLHKVSFMNLGTLRPVEAALAASIRPLAPRSFVRRRRDHLDARNVLTLRPTSRGKIIGQHPTIKQGASRRSTASRARCATVLVTGESGTGKELVVAALHDASTRRTGPLVTINCGAIPAELVESELFGHVKGAFTGAATTRRGHVANAEGGTLFLDEVGELPLAAQVKLLRVLQQREYTPVGESRAVKCDVRVVAATQPRSRGRGRRGSLPRGPLLPPQRDPAARCPRCATAAPTSASWRCTSTAASSPSSGRTDLRGFSAGALAAIEVLRVAGQRPRARERRRARRAPRARPVHRGRRHPRAGATDSAVEANLALARRDPRREPEITRTVEIRESADARSTADARNSAEATALPPPPKAARFDSVALRPQSLSMPAVVPFGTPERRGSNPAFPRVLPEQGFDLFSAVEQLPEQFDPAGARPHRRQQEQGRAAARPEPHDARGDHPPSAHMTGDRWRRDSCSRPSSRRQSWRSAVEPRPSVSRFATWGETIDHVRQVIGGMYVPAAGESVKLVLEHRVVRTMAPLEE